MFTVKTLVDFHERFFKKAGDNGGRLITGAIEDELTSGKDSPAFLKTDFGILIDNVDALAATQSFFEGMWVEMAADLKQIFKSGNFNEFIDNLGKFVDVSELRNAPEVLRGIIQTEVDLCLSFVVAIRNVPNLKITDYEESFCRYFFSKKEYETVSGNSITPPKLLKAAGAKDADTFYKAIGAESYIRDMARIIAETTGDRLYDLRSRYGRFKAKCETEPEKKLVGWFDSFGDLAEASVLPVVESALNGVANARLNPEMVKYKT